MVRAWVRWWLEVNRVRQARHRLNLRIGVRQPTEAELVEMMLLRSKEFQLRANRH